MTTSFVAGTYLVSESNRRYRVLEIKGDIVSLMTLDGTLLAIKTDSLAFYTQFPCGV